MIALLREHKGNSLIDIPASYTVIDLETTGLDPTYDDIIEMTAIRVADGSIIDTFSTLVNPGYEIDEFITELTGITNEMLSTAEPLINVIKPFLEFVGDSILVGHNVNFDVNFIYDKAMDLLHVPFSNDFVDTLRLCRLLFKDRNTNTLCSVACDFNLEHKNVHRSEGDCLCTLDLLRHIDVHVKENGIDIGSIKKKTNYFPRSKNIIGNPVSVDENSPIFQKVCVITGKLEKFTRNAAMQFIANIGGVNADSVTKKTDFLILGNNDYCSSIKGGKSNKLKTAEKLILSGIDITILSENSFYDMIEG